MLIATFGPTTAWAGKTITREGDVFTLEDYGTISAQDVMEYDKQGHLLWPDGGTRALVGSKAIAAQKPSWRKRMAAPPSPEIQPAAAEPAIPVQDASQAEAGETSVVAAPAMQWSTWLKNPNILVPAIVGVVVLVALIVGIPLMLISRNETNAAAAKASAAAASVARPFERLMSSTTVGINNGDYTALVRDAQFATDTYRPADVKGQEVARHLSDALDHYKSALNWWDLEIEYDSDHESDIQSEWAEADTDVQAALAVLGK